MASKLLFGSKLGLKNNPPRPKRTRRHHHLYPCCITVPTSTYSEGTYVVSIQNPRWTQMPCIPLSMLTQHTRHLVLTYYIFFSFSPAIPFIFSTLRFPLTPSRNSDPGSHSRLFSPLFSYLYREKTSALSCLVDSRRIACTHTRRSQQLTPFFFVNKFKSHHGGTRTPGPTLSILIVAFEGTVTT